MSATCSTFGKKKLIWRTKRMQIEIVEYKQIAIKCKRLNMIEISVVMRKV